VLVVLAAGSPRRGLLGSPVVGIPEVAHSADPPVARVATRPFTTRLRVVNKIVAHVIEQSHVGCRLR